MRGPRCPKCGSVHTRKNAYGEIDDEFTQAFTCLSCGCHWMQRYKLMEIFYI